MHLLSHTYQPCSGRRRSAGLGLTALSTLLTIGTAVFLGPPLRAHTRITTDLTWSEDVRSILRQHCMRCHSPGGIAPSYADFTTYGTDSKPGARAWATAIEEEVLTGRMPPWNADPRYGDFANARRLSKKEMDILVGWVQGGAPQGPRRDLPPPEEYLEYAWELGEPDLIVEPPVPTVLQPGEMQAVSEHTVELGIEEDTWITGYEFKPDRATAVHRITAWVVPPAGATAEQVEVEVQVPYDPFRDEDEPEPTRWRTMPAGELLLGHWARGDAPVLFAEGVGKRLRAGSSLRLRIEYQRRALEGNDSELRDRSRVGLFLAATEDEVDLISEALLLEPTALEPAEGNTKPRKRRSKKRRRARDEEEQSPLAGELEPARLAARLELREEVRVTSLQPLDLAGAHSLEVRAHYPDGRRVVLLLIDEVDADWPSSYWLREPLEMPRGAFFEALVRGTRGTPTLAIDSTLTDHLVLPESFEITKRPTTSPSGGMVLAVVGPTIAGEGAPPSDVAAESPSSAAPAAASTETPLATAGDPNAAAHMDHSPLHGGQFFMAANQYHHLEGALPEVGAFRLYFYDDFKQPVDPRNFAGTVVFERYDESSGDFAEETYPLTWPSGAGYLAADIPAEMPAEFFASVWLAGDQARFDFYFEETSKRIIEAPRSGPRVAGAEHSHERPPLTVPGTANGIVSELELRVRQLEAKIAAGDWLKLYVPAFDGRDLAEALLDELSGIGARERGRVRRAVSRVMQSAAALDRAGDLADEARAKQALQRFSEAVREIRASVP